MDSALRALFERVTRLGELEPGAATRTFGRIAVEKGFLTQTELDAAVTEQQSQATRELLGVLLLRTRRLTLPQILDVLKEQNRHLLVCTCGRQYLVEQRGPVDYRCGACGSVLVPPEPASLGASRIGPYEILGELGRGGIGIVYCARDPKTGGLVAVKTHKYGTQATAASLVRFRCEAENAARLDHPAIVRVLDHGEHEGVPWFAMELVGGEPLDRILPGLPLRARIELLEKICRGVAHAHAAGVVHGDLAPSNVMVTPAGPKVLDFGLSKNKEWPIPVAHAGGIPVGTPRYMSPEEIRGEWEKVDERCDTWALGVMLFQAIGGRLPFDDDRVTELARKILEDEPLWPEGPPELVAMVRQALDKDRPIRYRDAGRFADDLRRWLAGEPVLAAPPSRALRLKRGARRNRQAIVAMAALISASLLVAIFAAHQQAARSAEIHALDRSSADKLSRGDFEGAMADLQTARELGGFGELVDRQRRVERLLTDRRRRDAARPLLADGLRKTQAALASSNRSELERLVAAAAVPLKASLAQCGDLAEAMVALGRLSAALGDDADADAWFSLARAPEPAAQLRLQRAIVRGTATLAQIGSAGDQRPTYEHVVARRWSDAVVALDATIAAHPIDGVAFLLRAIAKRELDRLEDALADARAALLLRPRDGAAWSLAGELLLVVGRTEEALNHLSMSLKFEESPRTRARRAEAFYRLGQYPQALGDIDEAIQRGLREAASYELRGRMLMKTERWRDARESLERAASLEGSRAAALEPLIQECRSKERR